MARIYSVLVVFALVLLTSNIILGYCIGDWNLLVQRRVAMKKQTDQLKKTVNIRKYELRAIQQVELARLDPDEDLPVSEEQVQATARHQAAKDALQDALQDAPIIAPGPRMPFRMLFRMSLSSLLGQGCPSGVASG